LDYLFETTYVVASLIFIVGTICFWPGIGYVKLGCRLFDVGSILFVVVSVTLATELVFRRFVVREWPVEGLKDMPLGCEVQVLSDVGALRRVCRNIAVGVRGVEALQDIAGKMVHVIEHDRMKSLARCHVSDRMLVWLPSEALTKAKVRVTKREILEQGLYVTGSIFFMVGTIIWDPGLEGIFNDAMTGLSRDWWLAFADVLFMVGSLEFAFAAYVNALSIWEVHYNRSLRKYALATATCFEFGGFCFIAGTMGFVPHKYVGCNACMEQLGCGFFLVGSILYFVGSTLSLCRCIVVHATIHEHGEKVRRIQKWFRAKRAAANEEVESFATSSDAMVVDVVGERLMNIVQSRRERRQENLAKLQDLGGSDDLKRLLEAEDAEDVKLSANIESAIFELSAQPQAQRMVTDWSALRPLLSDADMASGARRLACMEHDEEDAVDKAGFWHTFVRAVKQWRFRAPQKSDFSWAQHYEAAP